MTKQFNTVTVETIGGCLQLDMATVTFANNHHITNEFELSVKLIHINDCELTGTIGTYLHSNSLIVIDLIQLNNNRLVLSILFN